MARRDEYIMALDKIGHEIGLTIKKSKDNPGWLTEQMRHKEQERRMNPPEEGGGLQQPIYDPIDLVVDIASGGGTLFGRLIDSVATGLGMTAIDMAGGGPLTQMAGVAGGKAGIQAVRTAAIKSKLARTIADEIDKAGGRPLLDQAGKITYHGTPHKFKPTKKNPLGEFDLSKIGTGEGAQAYGHGIYLAEGKETGKYYKESLGGDIKTIDGKPMDYNNVDHAAAYMVSDGGREKAIKVLQNDINHLKKTSENNRMGWEEETIRHKENIIKRINSDIKLPKYKSELAGHLYEVDLPDEHIDKMLDWDKPLSEQPKAVQEAISPLVKEEMERLDISDVDMLNRRHPQASSLYHQLSVRLGGKEAASAKLNELGIPGIKYHDAMSRGAGEGTRNFVLFDPSVAKIINRE